MSINSGPTNNENPFYKTDANYSAIPGPFDEPNIRPSVLQSPPKQSPFTTIVTTSPSISMMQQPSATFTSIMPSQSVGLPWKCPDWMANTSNNELVEFKSQPSRMPFKRKSSSEFDTFFKSKQLITEEKVAADLDGLHISSDYRQHSVNTSSSSSSNLMEELEKMIPEQSSRLTAETLDIEEKLRRAQRITICDEIRKLSDEPLLPQSILDRFEKPCRALVLWQPPQKLTDLIVPKEANDGNENEMAEEDMEEANNNIVNNNNDDSIDLNNGASMELDF